MVREQPNRALDPEETMTTLHSPRAASGTALSEIVDGARGRVTARGQLTPQGADLLRGTVEGLCRRGHSTVVLDLAEVQVTERGLQVLVDLSTRMADAGSRLLLLHATHDERR
jgi:anti-anti-sigma regulatory factor